NGLPPQEPEEGMMGFGYHLRRDSSRTQSLDEHAFVERQGYHARLPFLGEGGQEVEDHDLGPGPQIAREDVENGHFCAIDEVVPGARSPVVSSWRLDGSHVTCCWPSA